MTVKLTPLLLSPLVLSTTRPVVAVPAGTGTTILVAVQFIGVVGVPLNVTVPVPWVDPNVVPVIVTLEPAVPEFGDKLVMCGRTLKLMPLLFLPPAVIRTVPVVAPAGTGTTMLVAVQLVGVAGIPLNVTVP